MAESKELAPPLVKEVRGQISIPYRWSYGKSLTRFFEESRDNRRLMGTKCPRCASVIVPAARICTPCYIETMEWVEVSDHGVLGKPADNSGRGVEADETKQHPLLQWFVPVPARVGAAAGLDGRASMRWMGHFLHPWILGRK